MLIKEISKEERPRERLLKHGVSNLSNEELLSIILRCGTKNKSVKELSSDIINEFKSINNLRYATINKLIKINGMGYSKSMVIVAMLELAKRIYLTSDNKKVMLNNPKSIFEYTKYYDLMFKSAKEITTCRRRIIIYWNSKQKSYSSKGNI